MTANWTGLYALSKCTKKGLLSEKIDIFHVCGEMRYIFSQLWPVLYSVVLSVWSSMTVKHSNRLDKQAPLPALSN